MRKLFISCPMRGRTDENIKKSIEKMHRIAETILGEKLKVIDNYIEGNVPTKKKQAVYYLGCSIQRLSEADYFIGIRDYSGYFKGCDAEEMIARNYNIPMHLIDIEYIAPDCCNENFQVKKVKAYD